MSIINVTVNITGVYVFWATAFMFFKIFPKNIIYKKNIRKTLKVVKIG